MVNDGPWSINFRINSAIIYKYPRYQNVKMLIN